jgi:hypothetical protein
MSNIAAVIGWKFNNQPGMSTKDNEITEFPGGIPTQSEQDLWTAEYNIFVAANAYKGLRRKQYDLLNQDEMRFDDIVNNTTTWVDAILAIKAQYPKGAVPDE